MDTLKSILERFVYLKHINISERAGKTDRDASVIDDGGVVPANTLHSLKVGCSQQAVWMGDPHRYVGLQREHRSGEIKNSTRGGLIKVTSPKSRQLIRQ